MTGIHRMSAHSAPDSWAGRHRSGRSLWQLWEVIRDREPGGLAGDMDVKLRPRAGVIVQPAERHAIIVRPIIEPAQYRRPTHPAEAPVIPWRGFEKRHELVTLHKLEVDRLDGCPAAKGAPVCLPAHRAVAVHGAGQLAVDPVFDSATQTASAYHAHVLRWRLFQ
jgi:hypothetical protein